LYGLTHWCPSGLGVQSAALVQPHLPQSFCTWQWGPRARPVQSPSPAQVQSPMPGSFAPTLAHVGPSPFVAQSAETRQGMQMCSVIVSQTELSGSVVQSESAMQPTHEPLCGLQTGFIPPAQSAFELHPQVWLGAHVW
jgi:hypothetical protein